MTAGCRTGTLYEDGGENAHCQSKSLQPQTQPRITVSSSNSRNKVTGRLNNYNNKRDMEYI